MQKSESTPIKKISTELGINIKNQTDDEILKALSVILNHRFSGNIKDILFGFGPKQKNLVKKLILQYYSYSNECDSLYDIMKNVVINDNECIEDNYVLFNEFKKK